MGTQRKGPTLFALLFISVSLTLGGYFAFAAVQGDHGVLSRVQKLAEVAHLRGERDRLAAELAELQNRNHRLSDDHLDLDLLDEQARDVLGLIRMDELVIR
jgi:cell division protein FtsB